MKFIILCYPRTGSTLLISALGFHPNLNQGFDIFNPEQEGNDPWVHWREQTLSKLYGERKTYLNSEGKLDEERFDLSLLAREFFKVFDGTKIMYDHLDKHSSVWKYLQSLKDLRIIVLRRNFIESAVSFRIAMETNIWFVPNEKSYMWYVPNQNKTPPSPSLFYPNWYFDWFYNHYCSSEEFFVNLFDKDNILFIDYQELVLNWKTTLQTIQKHIGVEPIDIPMLFNKRTKLPIEQLITNYDEIRKHYANHPILAHHFETALSWRLPKQTLNQNSSNSHGLSDAIVMITTCEVNSRHGTGALVKNIIADTPDILSIRSLNLYGEDHDFGELNFCVSHQGLSRLEAQENLIKSLAQYNIKSIKKIFCVPYIPDDLVTAITLYDIYHVPLATHIMDDQNICENNIPDQLMQEFLSKCSFRLVTHPELRDVYEEKYGFKFWLLPAVVNSSLIYCSAQLSDVNILESTTGALIGQLWNQSLFNLLSTTIDDAGIKVDWYNGSVDEYDNSQYFSLLDHPEQIKQLGIKPSGLLSEEQLAEALRSYPYIIIPTGNLNKNDRNPRLWRMIFAIATANIPIIMLGDENTSASRFVKKFDVGVVCDYKGEQLAKAISHVMSLDTQKQFRKNAALIAPRFSTEGINQWLWQSIDLGKPYDLRFEQLLSFSVFSEIPKNKDKFMTQKQQMTNDEIYQYFPSKVSHGYAGHIVDIHGSDYIDMMSAWGSNILGYGYQPVAEAVSAQISKYANLGMAGPEWDRLYELMTRLVPCAENIHLVKNGSDATAAAIRLARFVTGRQTVLHRGYHGVQDWYMASIQCPGVPPTHYEQIISLTELDIEEIQEIFAQHPKQIACLIIDPMVWPIPTRETMVEICDFVHEEGALLIFDEVVSGFRVAVGGAQEMWDVLPDLACYGKCIANGLPLSILVGSN